MALIVEAPHDGCPSPGLSGHDTAAPVQQITASETEARLGDATAAVATGVFDAAVKGVIGSI